MGAKIVSLLVTLALISWNALDISEGKHPALCWILIAALGVLVFFELRAILEEKKRAAALEAAID